MEQKEEGVDERVIEIAKRYNIDLEKLKIEQIKLAKNLSIKDSMDFSLAERVAGIETIFFRNRVISAIIVLSDGEVVEQEYVEDRVRFPYVPGFRAYRELPNMVLAFNKLDEKPDIVFIRGHGILHPRRLGIASHFSLAVNTPCIGIADSLIVGDVEGENIFMDGKLAGKIMQTKEGARPLYISPGNLISVKTSVELVRKFTKEPHKIPEPLRIARKYAKDVMKELRV